MDNLWIWLRYSLVVTNGLRTWKWPSRNDVSFPIQKWWFSIVMWNYQRMIAETRLKPETFGLVWNTNDSKNGFSQLREGPHRKCASDMCWCFDTAIQWDDRQLYWPTGWSWRFAVVHFSVAPRDSTWAAKPETTAARNGKWKGRKWWFDTFFSYFSIYLEW